jgi:hypothetical protein
MDFDHLPYGYKKYLPCSTPPRPDELLSSWLVRTAHQHCLKIQTFTKILWPNVEFWTRDIDLNPNPMLLQSLSEMKASSSEQIWNTTCIFVKLMRNKVQVNFNLKQQKRMLESKDWAFVSLLKGK